MGVFNSVYVVRPINKAAAQGVTSGALVSEWRTNESRTKGSIWCIRHNNKARKFKKERQRQHHPENDQRIFGLKKGRVLQLMNEEIAFLQRARLSRKDETYQLAIAMKMKSMDALSFSMKCINGLWTLLYASKDGILNPVSCLASELNCSIVSEGDKRMITRKLDKLEGIMHHYECIGWSVG